MLVLQQFLAGLDAEAAAALAPSSAVYRTAPLGSSPPPDSTVPRRISDALLPASHVVDQQQLSFLTESDVALLVGKAGPDFEAKGYGRALLNSGVKGHFILKANDGELTALCSQLRMNAVDMLTLREAISLWKSNPAQAFMTLEQAKQQKSEAHVAPAVVSGGSAAAAVSFSASASVVASGSSTAVFLPIQVEDPKVAALCKALEALEVETSSACLNFAKSLTDPSVFKKVRIVLPSVFAATLHVAYT